MTVGSANLMKQINLNNVRRAIREARTATKPQLAKLTGLSVVTINSLVEDLMEQGEVFPSETEVTSGGRPATAYTFNKASSLALILYTTEHVHKDWAIVSVINLAGEVIDRTEINFNDQTEKVLFSVIQNMLLKHKVIQSIGLGLPGQVIHGQFEAIDYTAFDGKALVADLSSQFLGPIMIENDVNAAVLGYCTTNHCTDQVVVGIYIPENHPLGSGILINGSIFKGRDGLAGEAKYLPDGVDWTDPSTVSAQIGQALKTLILTFTCLLNPDRLVIYRAGLTAEMMAPIIEECQQVIPTGLLPAIVISEQFHEDFANGIKQRALQPLLPWLNGEGLLA